MSKYRLNKENFEKFLNEYNLRYDKEEHVLYAKHYGYDKKEVGLFGFVGDPFIKISNDDIEDILNLDIHSYNAGIVNLMTCVFHSKFNELFEEIESYQFVLADLGFDNIYVKDDFIYADYNGITCTYKLEDKTLIENGERLEEGKYLPNELYNLLLEREG